MKDALEYLSWLDSVEADTIPTIGGMIQQNRWRLRFTQPTISEQTQPSIPVEVMKDVKGNLTVLAMSYVLTDNATQEKEVLVKEIRDIAVAIQSLRYGKEAAESGKESADLTRTNIKVAIWVPVRCSCSLPFCFPSSMILTRLKWIAEYA